MTVFSYFLDIDLVITFIKPGLLAKLQIYQNIRENRSEESAARITPLNVVETCVSHPHVSHTQEELENLAEDEGPKLSSASFSCSLELELHASAII